MRILMAAHGFPPTHYAGAERAAERIVKWLVERGHEVEVFAVENLSSPGFKVESSVEAGYTIHRLYYNVHADDAPANVMYDYEPIGQALDKILRHKPFDLVHVMSGFLLGGQVILTAKSLGLPVVLTLTEYWFLCRRLNLLRVTGELCSGPESDEKCARCLMEDKRRYRTIAEKAPMLANAFWEIAKITPLLDKEIEAVKTRRLTLKQALEAADLVISPSRFLISKFAEFDYDTRRFHFIQHGLGRSNVTPLHRTSGVNDPLRVGYIGQLKYHKGVDLVVEAVAQLLEQGKKISLDIWGPEDEEPEYINQLKERSAAFENIQWHGRYTSAQLADILNGFDILTVCSRWYENNPTVILEAFKHGLPVVGTNLGGMAELIQHEVNGLVFELNQVSDLSAQLERLADDRALLQQLRAGVPSIKTADQEVAEIFEQYQQLLAKRQVSP
jgi:glycosyltransferase involved in cell wall biosynthesis